MSVPLTQETLRQAYEYLASTPPFDRWNLPASEDVRFKATRSNTDSGGYQKIGGKHVIDVSGNIVGHTVTLMEVMAHEMVHLHQGHAGGFKCSANHDAAFHKYAAQVSKVHGFDPKRF